MKHPSYKKVISIGDIEPEARKLALAWFEYKPKGFDLMNKVKMASDIMRYAEWYHKNKLNKK